MFTDRNNAQSTKFDIYVKADWADKDANETNLLKWFS